MKLAGFLVLILMVSGAAAEDSRVYLVGKRQVSNSNHTHVVLFYAKEITDIGGCQKDIQGGYRGQWRHYHHKFPRAVGVSEKLNYYCIQSTIRFDGWYKNDPYDYMYQFDIRTDKPKIKAMRDYSHCLNDLRRYIREESPTFFCAKLSQKLRM